MTRSFWPTVLVGLVGAGTAAVAGNRSWVTAGDGALAGINGAKVGERPEVTAFALVALACWGVLLVTRGWFRRLIAVLAALAGAATVTAAVIGLLHATEIEGDFGWMSFTSDGPQEFTRTIWGWVALAGAVLATVAGANAVRSVRGWPEMGRKYDAPVGEAAPDPSAPAPAPETPLDVWKALDEGRDPTDEPPASGSH